MNHKFNNYKDSTDTVRDISDRLCLEYGYSIIEEPAEKGKEYAEWNAEKSGSSWKKKLKNHINDQVDGCTDFDQFLQRMEKLEEGKGVGYEQWAKIFNLKAFASSVLEAHQMDLYGIEEIAEHTQKLTDDFYAVSNQMKEIEEQMRQNKILKSAIIDYGKTNRIYKQYKASGKSKDYYEKHREELERHRAAKKVFDQYALKDFPSVKELDERFRGLEQRRKSMYEDYKTKRTEMQKWQNIQSNLEYGFRKAEKEKHHALER